MQKIDVGDLVKPIAWNDETLGIVLEKTVDYMITSVKGPVVEIQCSKVLWPSEDVELDSDTQLEIVAKAKRNAR